jgi:hypothetical protein
VLRARGGRDEGQALLRAVLETLTEGQDSADARDARLVLADLS